MLFDVYFGHKYQHLISGDETDAYVRVNELCYNDELAYADCTICHQFDEAPFGEAPVLLLCDEPECAMAVHSFCRNQDGPGALCDVSGGNSSWMCDAHAANAITPADVRLGP